MLWISLHADQCFYLNIKDISEHEYYENDCVNYSNALQLTNKEAFERQTCVTTASPCDAANVLQLEKTLHHD